MSSFHYYFTILHDYHYQLHLTKGLPMNCTAILNEIDLRVRKNESFKGTNVHFDKIQCYWELKKACSALLQTAPYIKHTEDVPPGRDHRHAIIAVNMENGCVLNRDTLALLKRMTNLADDLSVINRGRLTRYSFTIMNVWED